MKLLSQDDRAKFEAKIERYEALGSPILAPVVAKLRAWLAADLARREATICK